jgi:transposase
MPKNRSLLTDEQREHIRPFISERAISPKGGLPPADDRKCSEGTLWVLRSGDRWRDLPDEFSSPITCWRRMNEWMDAGIFNEMWYAFLDRLKLVRGTGFGSGHCRLGFLFLLNNGLRRWEDRAWKGNQVDGGG